MSGSDQTVHSNPLKITSVLGYRDAMVASLRRRLFGPTHSNRVWYTQENSKLIQDGSAFPDFERPVGPFHTPSGEEVLAVSPRNLYNTGILWGDHDNESSVEPTDEFDPQDKQEKPWRNDSEDSDDLDDEQVPEDVDTFGKRRTLSISFRVPAHVSSIQVRMEFGTYHRIHASFAGKQQVLWERTSHTIETNLKIDQSGTLIFSSGLHKFSLACTSRISNSSNLVTIAFTNATTDADIEDNVEGAAFQFEAEIICSALLPYSNGRVLRDPVDLLYRNQIDYAIGHGTDVRVDEIDSQFRISTQAIPVVEVPVLTPDVTATDGASYGIYMDDLAEFNENAIVGIQRILTDYDEWISERTKDISALSGDAQALAIENVSTCRQFLSEMKDGFDLAQSNSDVRRCLQDASNAMNSQRISTTAPLRSIDFTDEVLQVSGDNPHLQVRRHHSRWRPFQIAFILASLPKIVEPQHPGRNNVDVIWMPTGGGKTEAYLGLAAFTILWERLMDSQKGLNNGRPSTKVIMRYTLRLLTVQQFLRTASLICALELIREADPARYGPGEIRVGTWVGASATPNKRDAAIKKLRDASQGTEPHGFLLTRCPWCGCEMGNRIKDKIAGYAALSLPRRKEKRVLAFCPDVRCPFTMRSVKRGDVSYDRGLPVFEVDEDTYEFPPDFVIGTVDKVAMMWSQTEAQSLFGLKEGKRQSRPPALFIQDELHLITGPLGSIDGLYEVMLEELCSADGGRAPVFVASTATTRSFKRQIHALYGRASKLVPPPGIDIDDSFFSRRDLDQPPRTYVGICSSGGLAQSAVQLAVVSTLAHFPPVLHDFIEADGLSPDAYWTNVCFFSSRAALGTLTSLTETGMRSELDTIRRASGSRSGSIQPDGKRSNRRFVSQPREITATSSENVADVLNDLSDSFESRDSIDLCFATSMIEVGLDVPRLGLMTVIGQPKGSSQYIQVTGRVGRSAHAPALVVDVLGTRTPRDRSHYEHFISWHRRLYASVEGASVTPFTEQALDRTAPSVAAILCQLLGGQGNVTSKVSSYWPRLTEILSTRAALVAGDRGNQVLRTKLKQLEDAAHFPSVVNLEWNNNSDPTRRFLFPFGAATPEDRVSDLWRVLTSMRSVDPDAPAQLHTPRTTLSSDAVITDDASKEEFFL